MTTLPTFLKRHLRPFKNTLQTLAIASRGMWKLTNRKALTRALRGLAPHILVTSDVEAAWLTAFDREGVMVISGTGSIAYGRNAQGRIARAGGLGPEKGDEGSAYWIGNEWLGCHNLPRKGVRETAKLAPLVWRLAQKNNPLAKSIVRRAQGCLAQHVAHVAMTLKIKPPIPVSYGGSVLNVDAFRKGLFQLLGPYYRIRHPRMDTESAVALKMMELRPHD